jgi:hypothetical protein
MGLAATPLLGFVEQANTDVRSLLLGTIQRRNGGPCLVTLHLQLRETLALAAEQVLGYLQSEDTPMYCEQLLERRLRHRSRESTNANGQHYYFSFGTGTLSVPHRIPALLRRR